ncbi:MAG: DUF192 domain-containing protein [Halarchaeum sp.]
MDGRRVAVGVGVAVVVVVAVAVGAWAVGSWSADGGHERATVTVVDESGGTLGRVNASVADSGAERYRGLSGTASLGNGSGKLFVYGEEGERAFVMREMNYPLDVVFVGGDGRITAIRHAPTEEPPYREYRGRARWVLEVNRGWTTRHGVSVGDRVRIAYGDGSVAGYPASAPG